jgi:DNA-binding MarR family transcriptional regulator
MPRTGLATITRTQRPSQSPRDYQARLDRLRVKDYVAARMSVTEIARRMRKDKAWVSRTIRQLREENQGFIETTEGRKLVEENLADFESLVARARAEVERAPTPIAAIAALRVAGNLLQQKANYELVTGQAPKPPTPEEERRRKSLEAPWDFEWPNFGRRGGGSQ